MEIIDLNGYVERRFGTAVALGNFDGVHVGHEFLLKDNIKKAKEINLKSSVLLFKNHTKTTLNNKDKLKLEIITPYYKKIHLLKKLGIDLIYSIYFDESIMKLSPEEFVEEFLVKKLNSKLITVGFDYRFGYKAKGDSEYLKKLGKDMGFIVNIIEPIYIEGEPVSSTKIRNLLKSGLISKANHYLGKNYSIIGKVVKGDKRGTGMGFPTANLKLDDNYVIPKIGVYETMTIIDNEKYRSLTNIGYNPTFDGNELKIENHILDFEGNLYDKYIEVSFIDYIRDDVKFDTVEELINQIKMDIEYVMKKQ
ncbi:bifunctional riboflavin kinase/FAD synthetase [Tepidimicrobium xylanilyticum]|uniref:bifunctional riboflavin kinase/FAD synthetase n=1 Tax=Tepidimicrobium xylanilyticum TaxID=1123352 RepID=UPI002651332A|nr:bifunctional riboflavin kinase/FAD synthetase [Tepidimicrobium xylanilyticum]GMG97092.1 riboflavin biosynthesis protein [Tepidimicrobium xylanilyticum]